MSKEQTKRNLENNANQTASKDNKKCYEESMRALFVYLKNNEKNPSEKVWNQYAVEKRYLSSKTIGYLSKTGFNTLCRELRKQINKEKRQEN